VGVVGARPLGAQQASKNNDPTPPNTQRCRYVRLALGRDTTTFALADTLTIVPTTVTANGHSVSYNPRTSRYQVVRPAPHRFVRVAPAAPIALDSAGTPIASDSVKAPTPPDSIRVPVADSVLVCYRVLPVQLLAQRYRRPRQLMDSIDFRDRRMLRLEDFSQQEQILNTPGINKTGNLARGISFGNTQNVFVNSALNLQLEGKLTENIHLTAAISDQNVPFQPEGNTQTLQQFDKIYITLTGPQWNLTAGDVVLRNKPDYFLRYYKNIQGAAVEANLGATFAGRGHQQQREQCATFLIHDLHQWRNQQQRRTHRQHDTYPHAADHRSTAQPNPANAHCCRAARSAYATRGHE
jgi:hypothetical protein